MYIFFIQSSNFGGNPYPWSTYPMWTIPLFQGRFEAHQLCDHRRGRERNSFTTWNKSSKRNMWKNLCFCFLFLLSVLLGFEKKKIHFKLGMFLFSFFKVSFLGQKTPTKTWCLMPTANLFCCFFSRIGLLLQIFQKWHVRNRMCFVVWT